MTPEIKNILITGANGQLGSEFRELAKQLPSFHFIFTDREELDITDKKAVMTFFADHLIYYCVNCAAYTAVDKAEQERDIAEKINHTAVGHLAAAAKETNAYFLHISTDYVFNGKSTEPYEPDAPTDPVNFYGETKLRGEQIALRENPATIIIRTAWVYSSFGNNFVKSMMRLMKEKESLHVVSDQKGTPTYAADLAGAVIKIIQSGNWVPGIYHYTNEGETSWYHFAQEIAIQIDTKCVVHPITAAEYPTPAARPLYSVLNKSSIKEEFGIYISPWQDSLKKCIAKMPS